MNQDNQKKIESMNDEQFEMFFLLQYDRIDKLETKRENLSNYVLTVTAAIFTFGFTFLEELNIIALIFIIAINFAAIIFVSKTRPWVKLHQIRAEIAAKRHAPEIEEIEELAVQEYNSIYGNKKTWFNKSKAYDFKSDKDWLRRSRIYSYLHILIIFVTTIFLGWLIYSSIVYGYKKEAPKCCESPLSRASRSCPQTKQNKNTQAKTFRQH